MSIAQKSSIVALVATLSLAVVAAGAGRSQQLPPQDRQLAQQLLSGAVLYSMKGKLQLSTPGLLVTSVKCSIPRNATKVAGRCRATFTIPRTKLTGFYRVTASMHKITGTLTWKTYGTPQCKQVRGKSKKPVKVKCPVK